MSKIAETLGISGDSISQIIGKVTIFGTVIFAAIFVLIAVVAVIAWFMFDKKAIVFKAYADPGFKVKTEKKMIDGKEQTFRTLDNKEGLVLGKPSTLKARFVNNKNGVLQFRLMFPLMKITNFIPQEWVYPEGVYFVQIGNEYIPIKKPALQAEEGFLVKLGTFQSWKESNFLQFKKQRQKWSDKDVQMRVFALVIIAVIAIVLLAGFVLFLAFRAASGNMESAQLLANAIEAGTKNIAGGVPT